MILLAKNDFSFESNDLIFYKTYLEWRFTTKRLMYIKQKARGIEADGSCYPIEDFYDLTEKPLIEAPFDIRQSSHWRLADFLRGISKKYR